VDPTIFPEQFAVTREVEDSGVRLRLFGELDLATVPVFESEFHGAAEGAISLDLGELTFIDATGLRAILRAESQARGNQRDLTLMDGSIPVRRLFALTGNEHLLDGGESAGGDHE
jgi:anti-anti-sigma factor